MSADLCHLNRSICNSDNNVIHYVSDFRACTSCVNDDHSVVKRVALICVDDPEIRVF